jgi:hypothetical protein
MKVFEKTIVNRSGISDEKVQKWESDLAGGGRDLYEFFGKILGESDSSYQIKVSGKRGKFWISKKQITDTEGEILEPGNTVDISIPLWYAKKIGLDNYREAS